MTRAQRTTITVVLATAGLAMLVLGVLIFGHAGSYPGVGDVARSEPITTTVAPTTTTTSTTSTTTTVAPTTSTTVVPATAPAAAVEHATGSCGGYGALIAAYFPAGQVGNACKIAKCESGYDPGAVSSTNDHGIFQLNAGTASWPGGWQATFREVTGVSFFDGAYNPELNTQFAAWLWRQSGWTPWSCRGVL